MWNLERLKLNDTFPPKFLNLYTKSIWLGQHQLKNNFSPKQCQNSFSFLFSAFPVALSTECPCKLLFFFVFVQCSKPAFGLKFLMLPADSGQPRGVIVCTSLKSFLIGSLFLYLAWLRQLKVDNCRDITGVCTFIMGHSQMWSSVNEIGHSSLREY